MRIVVDDLSGSQIAEFLAEHVQQMRSITPLESKHALDLDAFRKPEVTFWSIMDGDTVVGCGALKRLDASHAELQAVWSLHYIGSDAAPALPQLTIAAKGTIEAGRTGSLPRGVPTRPVKSGRK